MLPSRPVVLAPPDPAWAGAAMALAQQLMTASAVIVVVHHIGSTAVPGLAAKPTIDLMPVVTSLDAIDADRGRVEALGYQWHGEYGIAGRRFCTLSASDRARIANVHIFEANAPDVTRHLAFRDYLRTHPQVATAYQAEKERARNLYPSDTGAYTDEKAAWIRATEVAALNWYAQRS